VYGGPSASSDDKYVSEEYAEFLNSTTVIPDILASVAFVVIYILYASVLIKAIQTS